jgi:hypothetical protein
MGRVIEVWRRYPEPGLSNEKKKSFPISLNISNLCETTFSIILGHLSVVYGEKMGCFMFGV